MVSSSMRDKKMHDNICCFPFHFKPQCPNEVDLRQSGRVHGLGQWILNLDVPASNPSPYYYLGSSR